jgi:hypothetical protein
MMPEEKMEQLLSPSALRALKVGQDNHWRFRIVGQGDVPREPVYRDEWWFKALREVPESAVGRLLALRRAGLKFKGVVIAHEAPRQLTAPVEPKEDFKNTNILPALQDAGAVLGQIFLFMGSLMVAAMVDPALIVVLDDGTWVEVMTWYEQSASSS